MARGAAGSVRPVHEAGGAGREQVPHLRVGEEGSRVRGDWNQGGGAVLVREVLEGRV